jgi:hypothetical protein
VIVANRILKVLLFDEVDNDQLVWSNDNHGCYSVKSGYNILLKQIGRGENLSCPLCEQCNEDDCHYLLDCYSRAVIQAAGLDEVISMREQTFNTEKEVIMHICLYESKDTAGKFEMLAWVLWNNRNNCVRNNGKEEGQ